MNALDLLQQTTPEDDAQRRLGQAVCLLIEWGRQRRARLAAQEAERAGGDQGQQNQGVQREKPA